MALSSLIAAASAQYGPDPKGVPADFMCGWRQLSYDYATSLRPDDAALISEALELGTYCGTGSSVARVAERRFVVPTASMAPADPDVPVLFVDAARGSDAADGSSEHPLRNIQTAIERGRGTAAARRVVVRTGTHYLPAPLQLTAADSNLTLAGEGNATWISGGVPLGALAWEKEKAARVWSADIGALGLDALATLRVDGRRLSPARWPNADPEREFWPVGYMTSKPADWMPPAIPAKPNPATVVNVTSPNRDWDAYFSNYRGGINGTCAIYDPPFSFWCQSQPFSAGCGGCFTWNIPAGLHAAPLAKRPHYEHADDMQMLAWRKAHWANWAFEVASLDQKGGEVTFGRGGFQGARGGPGSDWFVQNILAELDAPDEFYYDRHAGRLYVVANETDASAPPSGSFVAVPAANHTLMSTVGTQATPVVGLTVSAMGFRDAAWTMLQPHGVPSGGDW
jgi:hypothetical protein